MFFIVFSLIIPLATALIYGATFPFAFSLIGVGVVLYLANTLLIGMFVSRRAPETVETGTWDDTAGTGIVPKWVSAIGLISIGLVPAGLLLAILLAIGLIADVDTAQVLFTRQAFS